MERKNKIDFRIILKNNYYFLKIVANCTPELMVWRIILMLINVFISSYFSISFIQFLVNAISENYKIEKIISFIAIYTIVIISQALLQDYFNYYINLKSKNKLHYYMHEILFTKVTRIDMDKIENPEFYNNYIWALNEVDSRTWTSFDIVLGFIECLLSITVISSLLSSYDPILLIFGVIPVIINFALQNKMIDLNYKYSMQANEIDRKKDYIKRIFYLFDYTKELRIWNISNKLLNKFKKMINSKIDIYKKYVNKFMGLTVFTMLSDIIFSTFAVSIYLVYLATIKKTIDLGAVVATFNGIGVFSNNLRKLSSVMNKMRNNSVYADKIMKIIDYKSNIEEFSGIDIIEPMSYIEIKDVSFKYPGSKKTTLNNINIRINKGDKIAIVGLNGSGKSTLIKLLIRLYDPLNGRILYNGEDIKNFTTKEYRDKFALLLQDFKLYATTLEENLKLENENCTKKEIDKIMELCMLDKYKDMIEEYVTKEFSQDGLVFSGGENQKIGIARTLLGGKDIIIMDEPTSSLDPIAENSIVERIFDEYKNKTILIISHKLSIAKKADYIYFFEDGEVRESGTHEELIITKGLYSKLYEIQQNDYI